jgi:outer membrane receptor protein involved in Fe transport
MRSRPSLIEKTSILLFLVCAAGIASAQVPSVRRTPAPRAALEQQAAPPVAEPSPAAAPPAVAEEHPARRAGEEEIVVTGSRVRRKDLTTPAPVTVLTRQQLEESGRVTIGEFLQLMPEQGNAPNFQLNNGGATYSADGSTRINLRSLGVTRTLVLVNGRRMVPGGVGASAAVDLNSIPTAAVDHIEVLKDGASAIYGSDAIAGVVNIITRKSFSSTQGSAQYGVSGHGDAETFDASVTTGRSGDFGNFMFSAGYFRQGNSWLRDRDWSARALTYDYATGAVTPGGSGRTPQGTIALPSDANTRAGCTTLCQQLIASDPTWATDNFIRDPSRPLGWRVMTRADRYNFAAENYLTIPSERIQAYSAGDTRFANPTVRAYYEASYVQRNSQQNAAPMPLNPGDYTIGGGNIPIQVSKDSVYNPFGVDLPFAGRRLVEFGHREYKEDLGTFRVVTGVDGTLPEQTGPLQGWYWDASLNFGRTSGTFTTAGAIRNSRIADAVGPSFRLPSGQAVCGNKGPDGIAGTADDVVVAGCVPLNLFGGPNNGSIDPAQISGLGFEGTSRAFDQLFGVGFNTTGELFTLFGDRPVSLALGYEFRRQSGAQIADPIAASGDSADFNFQSTQGHYTANEAYGELAIPLLANVAGVRNLEANVAGRYVNYSTFGGNFTYKFGARYTPVPDVTVRGTYSTAFRAPSINELYLGQSETGPNATDPCTDLSTAPPAVRAQCLATGVPAAGSNDHGTQQLARVGGNGKLKPETARIFTAGVVLQPRMVRNLSVTVDYYHITVDDLVGTIGVPAILAGCYPASGQPVQAYCSLITRASGSGRILFVTDINQNVGSSSTAGIDVAARYAIPSPIGRFGLGLDGTWLAYFDRSQVVGTGIQTISGRGNYDLGALPTWKVNAGATWRLGGWSASGLARYVGTFKECATPAPDLTSSGGLCYAAPNLPSRQVGHNVTLDLNASYTLLTGAGRTLLLLGVNNVFDQAPQYVYSAALANSDPSIYDYVGRYVYTRVQHTF